MKQRGRKSVPSAHEKRAKKKKTHIKAKRRPSHRGKIVRGKWVLPGALIETPEAIAEKQAARRHLPKEEIPAEPETEMPQSPSRSRH